MSSRIEESTDSPQTVEEARDAIERSRHRISTTLDQLETRIVEKKHEIQDRVDVLRPAREQVSARPFTAVAVAFGVGAFLGALGGGSDDSDTRRRSGRGRTGSALSAADRQELREWRRARRDRLRSSRDSRDGGDTHDDDDSRFDALKHQLMGAVTSAITSAVTARLRSFARNSIVGDGHGDGRGRTAESSQHEYAHSR
jgi:ElaB/YqjD/DUF883 family membrane-anchored ribosome-binding protein